MSLSRRQFIVAGLGAFAAGCASNRSAINDRPGPDWPLLPNRPQASGTAVAAAPAPGDGAAPAPPPPTAAAAALRAIPRSTWAKAQPIPSRLNPLGSITRITVHHEGWTPVHFTDTAATAARLDSIRRSHLERLHAGDIGYHLIIDRSGRLWEGRSLRYQGAHVSGRNEQNIGIMVLGNFDKQSPSSAQLATLQNTLIAATRQFRVPISRVYTHRELGPTSCPGDQLQSVMLTLRRSGRLG